MLRVITNLFSFQSDEQKPGEGIRGNVLSGGRVNIGVMHEYELTDFNEATDHGDTVKLGYLVFTQTTIEELREIVETYDRLVKEGGENKE